MNTSPIWAQYEERLARVSDYIHQNLDDVLDMEKLAQIACLSQWHWHRIYRGVYGETVTTTIKRLRLHRAANELVETGKSLALIAQRAGYPDLSSFNRTFKKTYGLPPGKYRKSGGTGSFIGNKPGEEFDMYQVEIKDHNSFKVAGLRHQGSYASVGICFEKLNALAAARGLFGAQTRAIGIYYDDPSVVPPPMQRSFACLSVAKSDDITAPLEMDNISGGKYAVFRYKGPYSNMESCYRWVYEDWLKTADMELRDEPGFTEYLNPREKHPNELLTNIFIPLI